MILKVVGFTFRDSGRNIAVLYKMIKPNGSWRILKFFILQSKKWMFKEVQGHIRPHNRLVGEPDQEDRHHPNQL